MKLPPEIKIGATRYAVVLDNKNRLGSEKSGEISYKQGTITIEPDLCEACEAQVLMHEIVHGVLYVTGDLDHDEGRIDRLAHALIDTVLSSPYLLDYWQKLADSEPATDGGDD